MRLRDQAGNPAQVVFSDYAAQIGVTRAIGKAGAKRPRTPEFDPNATQTAKLSPQPHMALMLGLSNLKASLMPSRR